MVLTLIASYNNTRANFRRRIEQLPVAETRRSLRRSKEKIILAALGRAFFKGRLRANIHTCLVRTPHPPASSAGASFGGAWAGSSGFGFTQFANHRTSFAARPTLASRHFAQLASQHRIAHHHNSRQHGATTFAHDGPAHRHLRRRYEPHLPSRPARDADRKRLPSPANPFQ